MSVQLLVVDLDGTLLTSNREIPPRVLRAVQAAQARGVRVCVATGRIWPSAEPYVRRVGADPPTILYNGGMVYDFQRNTVLRRVPLAYEHARAVLEVLRAFPQVQPHLYVGDRVYVGRDNALSEQYRQKNGIPVIEVGDLVAFLPSEPMKILIVGEPADLMAVWEAIKALPLSLNAVFSEETYLEVLPTGSSKGAALEFVAQTLKVPPAAIVAVGDHLNDLEMMQFAGIGVAMGNADEALRAQADYVTATNDEEGLRDVIERFILTANGGSGEPKGTQRRREHA